MARCNESSDARTKSTAASQPSKATAATHKPATTKPSKMAGDGNLLKSEKSGGLSGMRKHYARHPLRVDGRLRSCGGMTRATRGSRGSPRSTIICGAAKRIL